MSAINNYGVRFSFGGKWFLTFDWQWWEMFGAHYRYRPLYLPMRDVWALGPVRVYREVDE